jgi:hypothetical protein
MPEIIVLKNNRAMRVSEKQANAFERAGIAIRSEYMTRDMRAVEVPAVVMPDPHVEPEPVETTVEPADDLESMEPDELRALAESRGIKVHHRAGKDKILAALRGE